MLCVWSCWNLRHFLIAQASNYLLDKPVHSLNRTQVLEHLRALVLSLFRVWLVRKGFPRKIVVHSSLNLPFMRGLYHSVTSIKDAQNLPRYFSRLGSRTPTLRSANSQFMEMEFRPKLAGLHPRRSTEAWPRGMDLIIAFLQEWVDVITGLRV